MMINNDSEYSTNTVMTESKTISSNGNNIIMSPTINLSNLNGEEQSVQNIDNDLNENESQDQQLMVIQKEENGDDQDKQLVIIQKEETDDDDQDKQLVEVQNEEQQQNEDDEFIRITAAHQMLTEAQTYDEQKNYPAALHLYRICVDLLLEELMFTEGTEQSRVYLREKCTAIMDRIDLLKTMLDPIPPPPTSPPPQPITTTTTDEQITNPPTDELNSLHLS